jgi:hypothetical protein
VTRARPLSVMSFTEVSFSPCFISGSAFNIRWRGLAVLKPNSCGRVFLYSSAVLRSVGQLPDADKARPLSVLHLSPRRPGLFVELSRLELAALDPRYTVSEEAIMSNYVFFWPVYTALIACVAFIGTFRPPASSCFPTIPSRA